MSGPARVVTPMATRSTPSARAVALASALAAGAASAQDVTVPLQLTPSDGNSGIRPRTVCDADGRRYRGIRQPGQ